MNDFEGAVRAMLRERASDIATLPRTISDLETVELLDTRRHRHTGWLVAAAVAAIVAIGGVVFAVRPSSHGKPVPPATHRPTATHTSTTPTLPPTGHAARDVQLSWFGMSAWFNNKANGYWTSTFESDAAGYRWATVVKDGDLGMPLGCNGCQQRSADIFVFDKGRFDAAKYSVTSWSRVRVAGTTGYLGTMNEYGMGGYPVPTVAWQYGPDAWALVQGVTPMGGATATLLAVANSVEPTVDVPITLPFTLHYVPNLPIVQVTDNRGASGDFNVFVIMFRGGGREFNITIWPTPELSGRYNALNPQRRNIGGLSGFYDPQQGAGVVYAGGALTLSVDHTSDGAMTAQDRRDLLAIIDGLRWTNGNGSPPFVSAEKAIP